MIVILWLLCGGLIVAWWVRLRPCLPTPLLGAAMNATRTRLIVNQCVAHDLSQAIADGDEIAFLPPMSGG